MKDFYFHCKYCSFQCDTLEESLTGKRISTNISLTLLNDRTSLHNVIMWVPECTPQFKLPVRSTLNITTESFEAFNKRLDSIFTCAFLLAYYIHFLFPPFVQQVCCNIVCMFWTKPRCFFNSLPLFFMSWRSSAGPLLNHQRDTCNLMTFELDLFQNHCRKFSVYPTQEKVHPS